MQLCLQDVLEDKKCYTEYVLKTSSRRLQYAFTKANVCWLVFPKWILTKKQFYENMNLDSGQVLNAPPDWLWFLQGIQVNNTTDNTITSYSKKNPCIRNDFFHLLWTKGDVLWLGLTFYLLWPSWCRKLRTSFKNFSLKTE